MCVDSALTHDTPTPVDVGVPLITGKCICSGTIDFSLAASPANDSAIEITVYAWLDGTALTQSGATKTAGFTLNFNA